MKRILAIVLVLVCTLVLLPGGCRKNQPTRVFHVAFVTNSGSDFWTIARAGCAAADEELPEVDVEFKIPKHGTAQEQEQIVDDLLARGIDGIAISPVDASNQVEMLNRAAAKTLLVTQDSDAPTSNRAFYVGTDNLAAGHQAGDLILKALPQGGKIMLLVGKSDAENAKERIQGIREALRGSRIEILGVLTDDTDRASAKANVVDTLQNHPDVACLVGLWSYNGPVILRTLREEGKAGKVKIVCFDEEDLTLQGVASGEVFATVVQQPYEFGYQTVQLMAKVLGGDRSLIPPGKEVIVPTLVVDRENVAQFWATLKRLRGEI